LGLVRAQGDSLILAQHLQPEFICNKLGLVVSSMGKQVLVGIVVAALLLFGRQDLPLGHDGNHLAIELLDHVREELLIVHLLALHTRHRVVYWRRVIKPLLEVVLVIHYELVVQVNLPFLQDPHVQGLVVHLH